MVGGGSGRKRIFGERSLTTLDIKLHRDKWLLGFGSLQVIDLPLNRRSDIFILVLVILVIGQVETIKLGSDLVLYRINCELCGHSDWSRRRGKILRPTCSSSLYISSTHLASRPLSQVANIPWEPSSMLWRLWYLAFACFFQYSLV